MRSNSGFGAGFLGGSSLCKCRWPLAHFFFKSSAVPAEGRNEAFPIGNEALPLARGPFAVGRVRFPLGNEAFSVANGALAVGKMLFRVGNERFPEANVALAVTNGGLQVAKGPF